jgi:hypothetical protein
MELWMTCTISTIRPWRIGDRIVGNILLIGFGTNIIMICYLNLSSQGMSSELGVRQWRSSWRILCTMRSNVSSRRRLRRRRGYHRRPNNRGGVRDLELRNITWPNRKRWTDMLEMLTLGVRPLRHGHRYDRRQLISLRHVSKTLQFIVIVVWKVLGVHLLSSYYCSFRWWTRHWFNQWISERHNRIASEDRGWGTRVLLWWHM